MRESILLKVFFVLLICLSLSAFMNVVSVEASSENVAFDSEIYADMNADVRSVFGYNSALLKSHWQNHGAAEGRKSSLAFDVKIYLKSNSDLQAVFGNNYKAAYEHFVNYGIKEGRKASIVFDVRYYLASNSDLKAAFGNNYQAAYEHFVNYGVNEGRKASVVFDVRYYLDNNSDLKAAFGNNYKSAYKHFMVYGINEGRRASGAFDVNYYLANNSDLKAAFRNNYEAAYEHYLNYGINEGRKCVPTTASVTLSATQVSKNADKYYGQKVNYTPANGDTSVGWKIFYADENNIYLIADDCIEVAKAPTKNGKGVTNEYENSTHYAELGALLNAEGNVNFNDSVSSEYTGASDISDSLISKWLTWGNSGSTAANARATAYLVDTEIWNASYGNSRADYVLGAPTLEMYAASWNAKGYAPISCTFSDLGYNISVEGMEAENNDYYDMSQTPGFSDTLYYPVNLSSYWLASPMAAAYVNYASPSAAMATVICNGNIGPYWTDMSSAYGLRPVVCLKSGVKLEEQSNGTYSIK